MKAESRARERGAVLELDALSVSFQTPRGRVEAVSELSLSIAPGECVGIVGESGAGKSQAFLAVMGLVPPNAIVSGRAQLAGLDLLRLKRSALNRVRGARIAMVFQDPMTSLTPHLRIGDQIAEVIVRHAGISWREARTQALELLDRVHMTDAPRRLTQYPHELSGGMRQRAMIAIALACKPSLLIADEPTTSLDVTIQAQILALFAEIKREQGMSIALITHDLGVVAGLADRVVVMQAGRVVESGPVRTILKSPRTAYTQDLLAAMPRVDAAIDDSNSERCGEPEGVLLNLTGVSVEFPARGRWLQSRGKLRALHDIDLDLRDGEALGVVGESGSGKSTLARTILQLIRPSVGQVVWLGNPLHQFSSTQLRPLRRDLQIIFQDPLASLDPRMTVGEIVGEPLRLHRPEMPAAEREAEAGGMLRLVGLPADAAARYPHELSGGQCQRIGIARAMVLKPRLLICDEPVSALDVLIQSQILQLLEDLRRTQGMSILFVSHNLAVVRQLCDRVLVLYLGRRMELAATRQLFDRPAHPYTRALIASIPVPDPAVQPTRLARLLEGEMPSPLNPPTGCVFNSRCPHAADICHKDVPAWEPVGSGGQVACHRWRELSAASP